MTRRDPNSSSFWLSLAALTIACVPYPFAGSAEPLIAGFPLWFLVSLLAAASIVALTVRTIWRHWQLESGSDERGERPDD